mgnify:CR=1 FL=1
MPYMMQKGHKDCEAGEIAVVKKAAPDHALGCHASEEDAQKQIDALYLEEGEEEAASGRGWRAVLVVEDTMTGDRRTIEADALSWRDLPLPLLYQPANNGGHDGAVVVGRIDAIDRDGTSLIGSGVFDTAEQAVEVVRLIEEEMLRGVSVDLDDLDADVVVEDEDDEPTLVVHKGRIMGATIVAFPAFQEATIALEDAEPVAANVAAAQVPKFVFIPDAEMAEMGGIIQLPKALRDGQRERAFRSLALTASAPPEDAPPADWFTDPVLERRRGLHIEADGRVWGHVYGWGECHLGSPPGQCITVPRGATDGGFFAGQDGRGVLCADGVVAPTGPLVLAADHAGLSLSWLAAKDHYANTALAWADACSGEDAHGIWVAGMVRPGTAPELVHAARASAPSVDCRAISGRLRLIALLSVNMPGYPALAAHIDGVNVTALVASSARIADAGCGCEATEDDLAELHRELARLRVLTAPLEAARQARMAERDAAFAALRIERLAERDERILA